MTTMEESLSMIVWIVVMVVLIMALLFCYGCVLRSLCCQLRKHSKPVHEEIPLQDTTQTQMESVTTARDTKDSQ